MPFRTRFLGTWLGLTALLVAAFTLAFTATLQAQVVNDPRVAEFDPSPDHWGVLDGGQPAVVRYELGVYVRGASAPFATVDMGKPSPDAAGKIRYDFASRVAGWPLPGGNYEARVSAVGPEGEALSDPSNLFTFATALRTTTTVSWTTPAAISVGTPLGAAQLNARASVAGAFAYNPAAGTVLAAGTHTLTATFTPSDTTLYTTAIAYTSLTVNSGTYQLTISRPSGGMVRSAGISCGTAGTMCQVTMPASMSLGLDATPDAGYRFSGWTGDCGGTSLTYLLQLNGRKSCGATFTAVPTASATGGSSVPPPAGSALPRGAPYTLTITRPSGGVVKAAGISCGTNSGPCAVTMPGAMQLGLEAWAEPGYVFLAWTGHCSGGSWRYALALEGPRTCSATFTAAR